MLSIHDLLEDPKYKEFFCKVPKLPEHITSNPDSKPWRLFIKLKGEDNWRSRDFHTYKQAFVKLKKMMPRVADAAITSKVNTFDPPYRIVRIKGKYFTDKRGNKQQVTKMVYWKPKLLDEIEEHHWCSYCRRPTIFRYFITHHALPARRLGGMPIDPTVLRCVICGSSERITDIRRF